MQNRVVPVVDRALNEVAHAGIALQPKQAVIHTELIRGGAGFAEVAASVLVVGPNLTLARAAGDEQAVMVEHKVERTVRLDQQAAVRLGAVELELRQGAGHVGIDVALDARAAAHHDGQVPFRQLARLHHKVQIGRRAGLVAQREHRALQSGERDMRCHVAVLAPI
jgi:hypothetical protein